AWTDRGEVLCGDVRALSCSLRGEGSLVVCNPPYIAPGRGRVRPAEAVARSGELGTFVGAARQIAGRRARVCFIYPAYEVEHLLSRLAAEGLHAKRMRFVHGTAEVAARVVLVEATAGRSGGVAVMPPLIERGPAGYTAEMEALLAPPMSASLIHAPRGADRAR
ncbi:MAG: hypothetical protein M3O36_17265, partial [Myxococcota bacterium]|nr:hypothetical protein [Myxococcota bacterium]